MKKIFFLFSAIFLFTNSSFCQEKIRTDSLHHFKPYWYGGVGMAYGFAALKTEIGSKINFNPSGDYNVTGIYASFGKGVNESVYGGYMINRHLGMECGFSYLEGQAYRYQETFVPGWYSYNYKSMMARAALGIRMTYGNSKYHPYTRMAFVIGFLSSVNYHSFGEDQAGLPSEEIINYSGGLSYGFNGGAGVVLKSNEHFSFFAELQLYFQNWSPKKSIVTKDISKGVDIYPHMTTSQLQIDYVSSFEVSPNPDTGAPNKELKFYYPFSSVGFNIGIQYKFGKQKTQVTPAYLK